MGVFRSIEQRIESLVEGVFGRAFRSHVQPVELARKLVKEMEDHKTVSVSRVYVPNEYHLYLAPGDRERFASYEESLLAELADYLSEHARREGYAMLSTPRVVLEEDADLSVGEFGIATQIVQPRRAAPRPPPTGDGSASPQTPPAPARAQSALAEQTEVMAPEEADRLGLARAPAALTIGSETHELVKRAVIIGRSRECDITIADPNISRHHAEIRQEEGGYFIIDLGSTNGTLVNGNRVARARLEPNDRIVLGVTELVFERDY